MERFITFLSVHSLVVPPRQQKYWRHMRGHWKMIILQTTSDMNTMKCCCIRCLSHLSGVSWIGCILLISIVFLKCIVLPYNFFFQYWFYMSFFWAEYCFICLYAIQICLFIVIQFQCFGVNICPLCCILFICITSTYVSAMPSLQSAPNYFSYFLVFWFQHTL